MTLNDIAYKIFETYRAYIKNTDSIDIREIYHKIHTTRAKLIKQKIEKYPLIPLEESFNQSLGSQKLELVDSSVVTGIKSYRKMLRTVNDIPLPIFNNEGEPMLTRISGGDLLTSNIKVITYDKAKYAGSGRFNTNAIYAYYYNNKIYLVGKGIETRSTKFITGTGVFQEPMVAGLLNNSSYTETSEYPISINMLADLENIILNEDYKLNVAPITDNKVNQVDDVVNIK